MEWINGMNAAVNYLEEHILEEPDLEKLGRLAGCSAHHFQRIFTYIGGITLSEYLRRRRMSLAAVDLKNESFRVIDIAQKYGYDSPYGVQSGISDGARYLTDTGERKRCSSQGISAHRVPDDCERNTGIELQN